MFINSNYSSTYINSKYIVATQFYFDMSSGSASFDSEDDIRDYLNYNRRTENCMFPIDDTRRKYITITATIAISCTNNGNYPIYECKKDVFNIDEYHDFIQEQREVYDNLIAAISNGDTYHIG